MDFSFTTKEEEFRHELRTWLEENLPEGWLDGTSKISKNEGEYAIFLRNWQRKLYEGGWAAIAWPEKYGGREATLMEEIVYQQEMVRVKAPALVNYVGIHMVAPTLMQIGTEEQKSKYIQKILTGEEVWCQGYSEPNAGSDLSAIQTSAVKDGDRWIINGQKVWTSFGHLADRCFLLARTNRFDKKHKGITVFLLDMNQPGVETRPIIQMDGQHDFNEVYLNDAIAYDAEIVGEVDEGWKVTIALLMHERTGIGGQVFTLEQQFNELVSLTKELKEDDQPLMANPLVRKEMLDLYTRTRGSLLNYYRNLTKTLKNGHPGAEGSMDKLMVSELTKELLSQSISLQGHQGVLWKEDAITANSYWQDNYLYSFGQTIGGGTSEIQKNTIGERILGLPKDMGR
ncbi:MULTISPECIES: acyl-CoA dehydrogenase family protein [Peribacillus]|uniref:acyl-CoA dehydrogenase family protein n=1 Tax=Peribacillus TaxID=2675229 RepID=UPI00191140A5|nr:MULTISPECIES: acyl-CoA dehydrogenase family protein [unclassified Peribacillus]MBK5441841.1 acyl-CoA dehydrogenase family protein [Peribacillus sp. TH24]MBK5463380.1 acyl-CoA dehydrogenase family protein [Peribacillus sp. TH27]MBK5483267.1 acyl-CoA dehydrogenase family protein [Peribacillus sp. TH16]MBK5501626.1 acyl-CoA dehydrogenase family protein [Peribacillus sp. TH14]